MFSFQGTPLALGRRFLALGGDGLCVAEGVFIVAAAIVLLLELLPPGDPGVEVADARRYGLRRMLRGRVEDEFGEA